MTWIGYSHYVYWHVAEDQTVLYVGCSTNVRQRTKAHRSTSSWFPQVAEVRVSEAMTGRDARRFERSEIARLEPPHNIQGTARNTFWYLEHATYQEAAAARQGGAS